MSQSNPYVMDVAAKVLLERQGEQLSFEVVWPFEDEIADLCRAFNALGYECELIPPSRTRIRLTRANRSQE